MPTVTIIMIFYNVERFMAQALRTVLDQSCTDWELLLVNVGSTDGSPAIAQAALAERRGQIRLLHHPQYKNRGMSASRTWLIAQGFDESFTGLYEDQVLYAKMALNSAIMPIEPCLALYQQHRSSTVAAAQAKGDEMQRGLRFLNWLRSYIITHPNFTMELGRLVEREISYCPLIDRLSRSPSAKDWLRSFNKWLVKLETRLLPASIRNTYWEPVLGIHSL